MKTLTALLRKAQEIAPDAEIITMQAGYYYNGIRDIYFKYAAVRINYDNYNQHAALLKISKNYTMLNSNLYCKSITFTTPENYEAAKAATAKQDKFLTAFYNALQEGLSDAAAATKARQAMREG